MNLMAWMRARACDPCPALSLRPPRPQPPLHPCLGCPLEAVQSWCQGGTGPLWPPRRLQAPLAPSPGTGPAAWLPLPYKSRNAGASLSHGAVTQGPTGSGPGRSCQDTGWCGQDKQMGNWGTPQMHPGSGVGHCQVPPSYP